MSQKVDRLFEALFALTDIRQLFRETAPEHKFNKEQKEKISKQLDKIRNVLDFIEKDVK